MATQVKAQPAQFGRARPRSGGSDPARFGWHALVLAILAAFCWQTSVTQAHFHPGSLPTDAAEIGGAHAATGAETRPGRSDDPLSCPVCRNLIHAGHLLPGTPPSLAPVVSAKQIAPALFVPMVDAGPQRSHFWQGRAPPAHSLIS